MGTSLQPAVTGPGGALERLRRESLRIGAALPPPPPERGAHWRRRREALAALARSGVLTRRLVLAAPVCAIGSSIFAFGGVYGWAYGIAYLLIFAALGAWSLQCWRGVWRARWQAVYAPLLAFVLLALAQAGWGLSAVTAATATALLHLGAGMVAFVLVGQVYDGGTDADTIMAVFSALTAALGLLAILQILTSSTGIYWHFTYAYASPAGSFVNKNNFAGCMEMLIPAAGACVYRRRHRDWLHLLPWALAPGLGVAAMVIAASRGGMLALAAEAVTALVLYLVARRPGSRLRWSWILVCAAAAAALVGAVGTQRLSRRLETSALHAPSITQRRLLNLSSESMFRARPILGWGLGTWAQVYPVYARFNDGSTYAFAHNDYLQLLAETGVAGAACGLAFWGLWGWGFADRLRRPPERRRRWAEAQMLAWASAIAIAGMLAHSWVDFNLHIPANLLLFFVLLALAGGGVKVNLLSNRN